MAIEIQKDIQDIKKDLDFIKNILKEEYELSDEAKKQLIIAEKTPDSEYVDQEDLKKELLR